jgi:hypothetical protein
MMERLFVSFSGGRTSALMAYRLKTRYAHLYELLFGFANTGLEDERTLQFVDRCDREWGLSVVWLEAVTHAGRKSCTHKVVDFKTAARDGRPFEKMIQKYGIPCKPFPHCTRELKANPIKSYLKSIGWAGCQMAIGIRVDEPSRIKDNPRFVYPLAHWFPFTKPEVNDWWSEQPFDLGLQDYEGNCTTCWKKSNRKLIRIATERPEAFGFMSRMEATYPRVGAEFRKDPTATPRTFFRGHMSAQDFLDAARGVETPPGTDDPDANSGCSESCEAWADL